MKSLLQTKEWAQFKVQTGWQAYNIDEINILSRGLFLGKSFLYVPEATFADVIANLSLSKVKQSIIEKIAASATPPHALRRNDIFIRLEINDEYREDIVQKLQENGFIKAFEEVQPEYRQIIDINKSEEDILIGMKEKGRYNIRIAQKHGVIVKVIDCHAACLKALAMTKFYKLFQQTAKRDGFKIRPIQYFEKLMNILGPHGMAEILVASYNGNIIAAEIVTYYESTASYLYGASSDQDRNVMAPYLLHWETINRAKEKGCKYYDMLAVDPEENVIANGSEAIYHDGLPRRSAPRNDNNRHHKYSGISRFKRQFGGRTVRVVGSWDYVLQPTWYKIFKIAEKIRRK